MRDREALFHDRDLQHVELFDSTRIKKTIAGVVILGLTLYTLVLAPISQAQYVFTVLEIVVLLILWVRL